MLDETELGSYGLKSFENVTPVVGSAMRGFPPDAVGVFEVEPRLQAATARVAIPSSPVNALRFIWITSPP
jgi:hypothetical protein